MGSHVAAFVNALQTSGLLMCDHISVHNFRCYINEETGMCVCVCVHKNVFTAESKQKFLL